MNVLYRTRGSLTAGLGCRVEL
ncbi:hypothetical protein JMJ77_0015249 [Colletotrichum scovillei]|uniref:Uncharacterized protein n=1 Tax=Colletotrichum scovillei TaxID=1209932 RepID=A0A9P7UCQ6_9PEZI|nr:hypothetical protein JMJ77_0015249 [Colletotrichum scovillei]KAG7056873.1 hypothetical protein JMJ78_0000663 [Colletotrichum scovillei]KAG7066771.1 hypothetical protein JMJ76_0000623 [Colletotrichum scovillei]